MPAQPSWIANIGIAKEAVVGTPVAPTAFIPVEPYNPKRVITQLEDKAWRGSAVEDYGQVQGRWHTELDIPGDVYADTFGWYLSSIFGDVTFTAGPPNIHAFSVLNTGTMQPGSKTITDEYIGARAFPAAMCVELTIKYTADGKLSYTSKWVAAAEATASSPAQSYSTVDLMPGWACTPTIRAATPTVIDGEVSLKRTFDVVPKNNSQDPSQIMVGPLSVNGKLTLMMTDDTYITQFEGNDQGIIDLLWSIGAGASLQSLQLHMTKAAWVDAQIDRGGSYVKFPMNFKALGNTTDQGASAGYSPIKATLKNAIATGIYQ